MKSALLPFLYGFLTLGTASTSLAQSTWNYFISDAGGGNSRVTWNVTGDLATAPGAGLLVNESSLTLSINAPGIFADSFAASGAPQALPAPDGSYFQYANSSVYAAITSFITLNAPGSGTDSFGLSAPLLPRMSAGYQILYNPGTQDVVLPIDFSDFNPGTYQSQDFEFSTPVTVNLTIGAVPEPSTLGVFALGGLTGWVAVRRRNLTRVRHNRRRSDPAGFTP